jgi:hypothetical protein
LSAAKSINLPQRLTVGFATLNPPYISVMAGLDPAIHAADTGLSRSR